MPRQGTLGLQVLIRCASVDSQFPLNCSKLRPFAHGFLITLPSLLLKGCPLAREGGCGFADWGYTVIDCVCVVQ